MKQERDLRRNTHYSLGKGMVIAVAGVILLGITGCGKKVVKNYENEEDFYSDVTEKKAVTVDGKEMSQYKLKNGLNVTIPKKMDETEDNQSMTDAND